MDSQQVPEFPFQEHYRLKSIQQAARVLRHRMTPSEKVFWSALRKRQLKGLKFLRQHPIGHSIVDFYCHEKRLAIEVDGGIHQSLAIEEHDCYRQELLELYGINFFRCQADEVENDLTKVLERLCQYIDKLQSTDH